MMQLPRLGGAIGPDNYGQNARRQQPIRGGL